MSRLTKDEVLAGCRGQWRHLVTSICSISDDILDGRKHPCPKCGGTDRFRAFDDFDETGGVICGQCHSDRNETGVSTIGWLLNLESPADLPRLLDMLAKEGRLNGHARNESHLRSPATTTTAKRVKKQQPQITADEIQVRDAAYNALLDQLTLSQQHNDNLKARGLPDKSIVSNKYRSWEGGKNTLPVLAAIYAGQSLGVKRLDEVVPGFFKCDLTLEEPAVLIPIRQFGKIIALSCRPDHQGTCKYKYVSNKSRGVSCGTPAHMPLGTPEKCSVLRVTEGAWKADIAFVLSGVPTIAFQGVNTWEAIKSIAAKILVPGGTLLVTVDADAADNLAVARAMTEIMEWVPTEGFEVGLETWDKTIGKGIDDLLAVGESPTVLDGDKARAEAKRILAAATEVHAAAVKSKAKEKASSAPMPALWPPGTRVRAGDRDNFGTVVADDGVRVVVHFVSPDGAEATKSFSKDDLTNLDYIVTRPMWADEFIDTYPTLREPVVDGLLRRGEIGNVISESKIGKSWMLAGMTLSAVGGGYVFGRFKSIPGKCLYLDNGRGACARHYG